MKVTVIPMVVVALGTVTKGLGENIGGIGNQWKNRDYPDHSIVEIGQNTNGREDITKKGNFERETESLLIAAQNNAIRINNVKV